MIIRNIASISKMTQKVADNRPQTTVDRPQLFILHFNPYLAGFWLGIGIQKI
jgi:hypothetical protein